MGNIRYVPYRVVRRLSYVNKHCVFSTVNHKEAVDYCKRAERFDPDAHYSIDSRCKTKHSLTTLIQPMPDDHYINRFVSE